MLSSPSSGGINPLSPMKKTYYTTTERETHTAPAQGRQYDSVSLSAQPAGSSRFHRALVSRISHEIRTATTTGDIQTLHEQVSSGEYKPDVSAIAARILLMWGDT